MATMLQRAGLNARAVINLEAHRMKPVLSDFEAFKFGIVSDKNSGLILFGF